MSAIVGHSEDVRRAFVARRRTLADNVIELELEAVDGSPLPDWEPGAHIDLRLGADLVRQYSLVPSPTGRRGTWTVAVLVEYEGRGGSLLIARELVEKAEVEVSGPRNHFPLVAGTSYLFIAGGIGVTPMIAMCRQAERSGSTWNLAYLGRSRDHMAYLDDLEKEFPDRVRVYAKDEGRRIDISTYLAEFAPDSHVYCCGPAQLMDETQTVMSRAGRVDFIHLEHFQPVEAKHGENSEFTVYAALSDIEFVVPADESILMAADFEGVVVPGDCLEGTCGSCETRVLLGDVDHRDSILGPSDRLRSETMMICVSRAKPGCGRLELEL